MKRLLKLIALTLTFCLSLTIASSCINIFMPVSIWDGEELKFTLTAGDVTNAETQLNKAKELTLNKSSVSNINEAWNNFMFSYYDIATQYNMATVMYYSDKSSEKYKQNYLFSSSAYSNLYSKYLMALKEIYNSPNKGSFFKGWTENEINTFLYHDEQIVELEIQNEELLIEYNDLADEEFYQGSIDIFKQTSKNNNEIAKKFKYANYYEYATVEVYNRDYSSEDREEFRNDVARTLIPIYDSIATKEKELTNLLNEEEKGIVRAILYDDYDAEITLNYFDRYVSSFTGSTKAGFTHAFENGNYLMTDSKNAQGAAFVVYLPSYNKPFCFFGPDYQNVFTIVHEIGHYYSYLYSGGSGYVSYDLLETHSQSNEMLLLEYLESELDEKIYDTVETVSIANLVASIIISTIVDEVEEIIYKVETDYSSDYFDQVIENVCEKYGGIEYVNSAIFGQSNIENYVRRVIVSQPVYYLSYATSGTASLALYSNAKENRETARIAYKKLIEETSEDLGFEESLLFAGFSSPFEDNTFTSICNLLNTSEQTESQQLVA